jgi:isoaspartyl peptidase/L-asparaginase-like protein (Ntn-hydrolase superfamily)
VEEALRRGFAVLEKEGALEAVMAAVLSLEENPLFNCGTGSALNLDGEAEMDASVMTSEDRFGAVGSVKRVEHPILLAKRVMEETDHLLIVGDGAERLARFWGYPLYDPVIESRRDELEDVKRKGSAFLPKLHSFLGEEAKGTVGAVARDRMGRIAVATSTGGYAAKAPGRIGDSAILGAGTYASRWGGASATGHGEQIWRQLLCFEAVEEMRLHPAGEVISRLVREAKEQGCSCGLIGIDWRGRMAQAFNAEAMLWGTIENGQLTLDA